MPKPTIKRTSVPPKVTDSDKARQAVQRFEEEYELLGRMKRDFANDFPDAFAALEQIKHQEDVVNEAIAFAHPLVQAAKETIGPFVCQRKWKSAHYDDGEFTKLATELDDGVLRELLAGGYIKKIALDKSATGYFAQHPDVAKEISAAWRKKKEQTPAITAPKI